MNFTTKRVVSLNFPLSEESENLFSALLNCQCLTFNEKSDKNNPCEQLKENIFDL